MDRKNVLKLVSVDYHLCQDFIWVASIELEVNGEKMYMALDLPKKVVDSQECIIFK